MPVLGNGMLVFYLHFPLRLKIADLTDHGLVPSALHSGFPQKFHHL